MKIAGSGSISSGIYDDEIKIAGSGKINGSIKCKELHASGSVKALGEVECEGEVKISGSGKFEDKLKCGNLRLSGSISVEGTVKSTDAEIAGAFKSGDFEAESFICIGMLNINGLLNAGNATIKLATGQPDSHINSIGGTKVTVEKYDDAIKAGFISTLFKKGGFSRLIIEESIETDEVSLENTDCPLVIGKTVNIGEGCKIGKVQYYDSYTVADGASVESVEKI